MWQNEFWNRGVRRVYGLDGATLPGGMPQENVSARRSTGLIVDEAGRPIDADYILTDIRTPVLGRRVAGDRAHLLALYRVRQPVRLAQRITGWYDDNWTGPQVTWTREQCSGGRLRLDLRSDPGLFKGTVQHVVISGATPAKTVVVHPNDEAHVLTLPLRPSSGTCSVDLRISPARIPSNYPQLHIQDSRLLGVHVDYFTYLQPR